MLGQMAQKLREKFMAHECKSGIRSWSLLDVG